MRRAVRSRRSAACLAAVATSLLGLCLATADAADWPGFRGPTGMGLTPDAKLPVEWGGADGKNVVWRAPLVGDGHASPIVSGDRLFVCTAHWPEGTADRKTVVPEQHVLCYALADGKRLWDTTIERGPWLRTDFRSGAGGGYASPTPCTDGRRVYVLFGSSVLAALDFDGRVAWRKEIVPFTFDVTIGSSPVLVGETVVLLHAMANKKDSKLVAYGTSDGSVRWETPLPQTGLAHSTPLLFEAGGRRQLVAVASGLGESDRGVQSFDPATGELLWWCRGPGESSSPAFGEGLVYCDSGRGGPGLAIDPTGSGDVTRTHVKWRVGAIPEAIGSPLLTGGLVYRVHAPGVLKIWRAADGRQVFAKRLDKLTSTWASPIADGAGRIYFASAGTSYVMKGGESPEVLAINELGDANHPSPAVADGRMYLVGAKGVHCIGEK